VGKNSFIPLKIEIQENKEKLELIQVKLEQEQFAHVLLLEEKETFHQYQKSLRVEEMTWRLKSRSLWLEAGDRNTTCFHKQARARLWRNNVKEISTPSGELLKSFEKIKEDSFNHFSDLYIDQDGFDLEITKVMLENIASIITPEEKNSLMQKVFEEEIKKSIWELALKKYLGLYGFTIHFYRKCWNTIKFVLIRMIQYVQKSFQICGASNSSFPNLIPKQENPSSFSRFMYISLCNNSYKIMTKIIEKRLNKMLPKIILENQGGFVEKIKIVDKFILV